MSTDCVAVKYHRWLWVGDDNETEDIFYWTLSGNGANGSHCCVLHQRARGNCFWCPDIFCQWHPPEWGETWVMVLDVLTFFCQWNPTRIKWDLSLGFWCSDIFCQWHPQEWGEIWVIVSDVLTFLSMTPTRMRWDLSHGFWCPDIVLSVARTRMRWDL